MNITNDKLMEILERNLGLPMGDGGIFYIEDPGQKRINKIYFSKTNMSLYKCTADNTDVTVTGNFKLYSLSNTDDYLGALTGVDRGQVKYIQDVGTKYVDKVYIDRPTGKLYRCVTQTSSVNNDANFVENNLKSTEDKLQNLTKFITKYVNLTKNQTVSQEYAAYEGAYTADVFDGYRLVSVVVADNGNCVMEGANFSHTNNRGYAFGFRQKSSNNPDTIEFGLYLTYIMI